MQQKFEELKGERLRDKSTATNPWHRSCSHRRHCRLAHDNDTLPVAQSTHHWLDHTYTTIHTYNDTRHTSVSINQSTSHVTQSFNYVSSVSLVTHRTEFYFCLSLSTRHWILFSFHSVVWCVF